MPQRFFLSQEDVTTLRSIASDYRNGLLARMPVGPPGPTRLGAGSPRQTAPRLTVFGLLDNAVEATTNHAAPPKSGTLNVYSVTSTGGTTDTGKDLTVYNLMQTPYSTDDWVQASQDRHGKWIIDQGGGQQVYFGKPQSNHADGATATYDLQWPNAAGSAFVDRGFELAGVFNGSGQSFSSDVNHIIFATQTAGSHKYVAFPYDLLSCEGVDVNFGEPSKLVATTSDNAVTKVGSYHRIDTPSTTYTTFDVTDVNGGTLGDLLILFPHNAGRSIVLKDGTGNLNLAGDFTMDAVQDRIMLIRTSADWNEITRSSNA